MPAPFKDLFTGQLVRLTAPRPEDNDEMAAWTHDAQYQRLVDSDYARPRNTQAMAAAQEKYNPEPHGATFHFRALEDGRLIGFVSIHSIEWNNQAGTLSIGIGRPTDQSRGYGSDALRLMFNYAFHELGLYRVGLDVIGNNPRAIRAYEKAGFKLEGTLRSAVYRDDQRIDRLMMGILRPEWAALP